MNYFDKKVNIQQAVCELESKTNEILEKFNSFTDEDFGREVMEELIKLDGDSVVSEVVAAREGLTSLDARLDKDRADINKEVDTKRDKSVLLTQADLSTSSEAHKLTMNHLSQDVKNAMTGTAPVSPNIADGSITTEKIAHDALSVTMLKEELPIGNLFNKSLLKDGYSINSVGNEIALSGRFVTDKIYTSANTVHKTSFSKVAFYTSDNTFISLTNEYDFTTPSGTAYIKGEGNITLIDNYYFVRGSITPSDHKYRFTLDGLVMNDTQLGDLDKKYGDIAIKETVGEVILNTTTTSSTIVLKRKSASYDNIFYAYRGGKLIKTVRLADNVSYTLNEWQVLFWDFTNNTVSVKNDAESIGEGVILAIASLKGKLTGGYLVDRLALDASLKPSKYLTFRLTNPYVFTDFLKFEKITISDSDKWFADLTFDKLIADLTEQGKASYHIRNQSPEWMRQVLFIPFNYQLLFNHLTSKFMISSLGYDFEDTFTVLAYNAGNGVTGVFKEQFDLTQDIKHREFIPSFTNSWKNEVEAKENLILQANYDDNFTFMFSTDMHVQESIGGFLNNTYRVLNHVDKVLNTDLILNGGDSVPYGTSDKAHGMNTLKDAMRKYHDKSKVVHIFGNHDNNMISKGLFPYDDELQRPEWILNQKTQYNILASHLKDVVFGSKDKMYFFKDFEDKKIRLIVLNSQDVPYTTATDSRGEYYKYLKPSILNVSNEQMTWLANTALKFDDKDDKTQWITLFTIHVSPFTESEGMTWNAPQYPNNLQLRQIIKAFKNGEKGIASYKNDTLNDGIHNVNTSYDFTSQGNMRIGGMFSGHNHLDCATVVDGYPAVTTTCGYPDMSLDERLPRVVGEFSEIAFDHITINRNNNKLKLIRFGAGKDRVFDI